MSRGPWKRVPREGKEDKLLKESYPQTGRESRLDLWNIAQFYGLRQKALAKGNLSAALRAQENIRIINADMAKLIGPPHLPSGNPTNGEVHEMLPAAAEGGSDALDGALEKSRGGKKEVTEEEG